MHAHIMQNIYLEVRPSTIEGNGVFAQQTIPKETRIIEYTGERITPAVAQRRYGREERCVDDVSAEPHFYLFSVDSRTNIDGSVDGNEARFINHSCEPNCEAIVEKKRVYIEALRTIHAGEELTYDYRLDAGDDVTEEDRQRYACHCGAPHCRGTMLALPKVKKLSGKRKPAKTKDQAVAAGQ